MDRGRIFVLGEKAAQDQRQPDDADLRDVGSLIETRGFVRWRQSDAKLPPVAFRRPAQLLERGAEHVFRDHDPGVGRDDDAFGPNRAVRQIAAALMQHGDGGNELADEVQRGVDVYRDRPLRRRRQQIRQPDAARGLGRDRQRGGGIAQPLDAFYPGEVGVAKIREPAGTFAQRKLERRNRRQFAAQTQEFERVADRRIADSTPFAETVVEDDRRRLGTCGARWFHE